MQPTPDISALDAAVSGVRAVDPRSLSAAERRDRLRSLRQAVTALEVAFDATVAASDACGDAQVLDGARSTTAWLRHLLNMTGADAGGHVGTARATYHADAPLQPVAEAAANGSIGYDQVRIISASLRDIPAHLHEQAVELLLDLAPQVDARRLRQAARHLRYVLDPDRGRGDFERQLTARRASLTPLLDGMYRLEVLAEAEGGALLQAVLDATGGPVSSDDSRTPAQRRYDALIDAVQRSAQQPGLPVSGGLRPQILVSCTPESFVPIHDAPQSGPDAVSSWRPALLPDGTPLPDPAFTRILCDSAVVTVVQERSGRVLDVGRTQRLFTPTQRKALWARDRGCRFPGCRAPWTHAHHIHPWHAGGHTDLANGLLLCGFHHRAAHDDAWQITVGPSGADGAVTFRSPQGELGTTGPATPHWPLAPP